MDELIIRLVGNRLLSNTLVEDGWQIFANQINIPVNTIGKFLLSEVGLMSSQNKRLKKCRLPVQAAQWGTIKCLGALFNYLERMRFRR